MKIEYASKKALRGLITKYIGASKGDSGSVLIIIGSEQYPGAAILAGMAALRAGVDYVGVAAPEQAAIAINANCPDLVTYKMAGKRITHEHLKQLRSLIEQYAVVLIGPGADLSEGVEKELIKFAEEHGTHIVLDADVSTLVPLKDLENGIIMVNRSEYEELVKRNKLGAKLSDVHAKDEKASKRSKEQLEEERIGIEQERIVAAITSNVLLQKNHVDLLFTKDHIRSVEGGSLRATVAGTGDITAGIGAALRAQGADPYHAALGASVMSKRIAELLEYKLGFGFTASDYLDQIPAVTKELKLFRIVKHI